MTHGDCVVIVDDDDSVREATMSLLRSMNVASVAFASAEEFLSSDWLDRAACLLLDVQMPGMNGLALQRHLADTGRRIPLIFITARTDEAIRSLAAHSGALCLLTKPVSAGDLLDGLRTALSSTRGSFPQ
jgi:FixJ family two-component response regulator